MFWFGYNQIEKKDYPLKRIYSAAVSQSVIILVSEDLVTQVCLKTTNN